MRHTFVGFMFLCASTIAAAQSELPIEVQSDLLLGKIEAAVASGDGSEALEQIAHYRELIPNTAPVILFLEAKLAAISKDYVRSNNALVTYFSKPEIRTDRNYAEAINMLREVETEAAATISALIRGCLTPTKPVSVTVGASFRDCDLAPEMVVVPGGTFAMGSSATDIARMRKSGLFVDLGPNEIAAIAGREAPKHNVTVRAFAVGKYEVTFSEWATCVKGGGCNGYMPKMEPGREGYPVREVSWDDAQAYVEWLSLITRQRYRLLSEAEWEYSARSGTGTAFSFGDRVLDGQANIAKSTDYWYKPVGQNMPNAFGLFDMHGNAGEWVQDCANYGFKGAPVDGEAWLAGDCGSRIYRGWGVKERWARSANRTHIDRGSRGANGIRVARDLR